MNLDLAHATFLEYLESVICTLIQKYTHDEQHHPPLLMMYQPVIQAAARLAPKEVARRRPLDPIGK